MFNFEVSLNVSDYIKLLTVSDINHCDINTAISLLLETDFCDSCVHKFYIDNMNRFYDTNDYE